MPVSVGGSLLLPFVKDAICHHRRPQELELRWQEYYELVTLLLQWIRHHVIVFEERRFPTSYEEIEVSPQPPPPGASIEAHQHILRLCSFYSGRAFGLASAIIYAKRYGALSCWFMQAPPRSTIVHFQCQKYSCSVSSKHWALLSVNSLHGAILKME